MRFVFGNYETLLTLGFHVCRNPLLASAAIFNSCSCCTMPFYNYSSRLFIGSTLAAASAVCVRCASTVAYAEGGAGSRALPTTMVAAMNAKYGSPRDVLTVAQAPLPSPGNNEVLIQVKASSINSVDWRRVTGEPKLLRLVEPKWGSTPRIQGRDVAGVVVGVGAAVHTLRLGDEVVGSGYHSMAEYTTANADLVVQKPSNLSFAQAAAMPLAAYTALQGLRNVGNLQRGQSVLVVGASGGVGSYAVQLAKHHFGAASVTGVCRTRNLELVKRLGADRVIDYTQENWADATAAGEPRYDVILQAAGTHWPSQCRPVLTATGTLVQTSGDGGSWGVLGRMIAGATQSRGWGAQRCLDLATKESRQDLILLVNLLSAGVISSRIDRIYPLPDAVEAFEYFGRGARGKIIIAPAGEEAALATSATPTPATQQGGGQQQQQQQQQPPLTLTNCVNTHCPWSGDPVSADSLTRYHGRVVGFCNPGCRDKFEAATTHFAAAAAGSTSTATPAATEPLNATCPWSGKAVQTDSLARYGDSMVGFCNPGCRDKYEKATRLFDELVWFEKQAS